MRAIRVILYDSETERRFMDVYRAGLKEGKSYQIRENESDVFSEAIQDFSLPPESSPNWNGIVITPSRVITEGGNKETFDAILALLSPQAKKENEEDGTV